LLGSGFLNLRPFRILEKHHHRVRGRCTHHRNKQRREATCPLVPEEQSGQVDRSVCGFISHETAPHNAIIESYPIIENDVGVEQGWVEGFSRLESARPPADVPLRRWVQVIDDFGRLVDGGFAKKAAMLGWTGLDLFGCDREKPFARIDRQGLCWLIAGNRLIELSETGAIIETWTGARQTWRRKPSEPGRVLAWELMP
jgi:hypothetical protein